MVLVEPFLPLRQGFGHPRTVGLREVVNSIFYWSDNGIKWRAMPHDLPNWSTVYDYYSAWVKNGLWAEINAQLVTLVRLASGRADEPILIVIDSQSVRTVEKADASPRR